MFIMRILPLLALLIGCVRSLTWDVIVGRNRQLDIYYKGSLADIQDIPSANEVHSINYDPVYNRVLIVDYKYSNASLSTFDLSTKKIQHLFTRDSNGSYNGIRVVYDPATQLLFWKENERIYSFSLNTTSSDKALDEKLLVILDHVSLDIAVDSCRGYIYWITDYEIERARLDGTEREVLIKSHVFDRRSLAIDQQTQKIYWTEKLFINSAISIESANFNGKDRTTIYIVKNDIYATSLAISKDSIYWQQFTDMGVWQLSKNSLPHAATQLITNFISNCVYCRRVAVKYTIEEQIEGIKSCDHLRPKPEPTVAICHNYCLQGNCSINVDGKPKCSCKASYFGERCEVNACNAYCLNGGVCSLNEENEAVCRCTADYKGERCEVSICNDYCLQGYCSVSEEGQPRCSCKTGYFGERCEVETMRACQDYCLNGGDCSLNEEDEPICQCSEGFDGKRCEVTANNSKDNFISAKEETTFRCDADNSGETKVNACHQYCLNSGVCSLNEKSEPVCQCTADYEGERCDVPAFLIKCFLYAYSYKIVTPAPVTPNKAVKSTCASPAV